ncbi:hypothetical protein TURU_128375 [Turdus rufiventris]|nr:hypothetical protein TURU_128375 [Turdus rufiventris]
MTKNCSSCLHTMFSVIYGEHSIFPKVKGTVHEADLDQFYIMQIAGDDVKLTEIPEVMNLGHSYETEIRIADDQRK